MKKFILSFWFLAFIVSFSLAQEKTTIKLNNQTDYFKVVSKSTTDLRIKTGISKLNLNPVNTKSGDFYELEITGLLKTFKKGLPNVPVYSKLIEIPQDATISYNIISYEEEIVSLEDYNANLKISPAQPSISKSADLADLDFFYNEEIYQTNEYFNSKIVEIEEVGMLRDLRLANLTINPVQYNPVKNELKILNNLEIEIVFENSNISKTQSIKSKYYSPFFENVSKEIINANSLVSKELIEATPVVYVIVSPPEFEATLQPFVEWKKLKGFDVIEAYTDNPEVGTTTTSIKNYLKGLYESETPQTFVLIVGDHQQIPAHSGVSDYHVTDLYYMDYTNDNIPDVYSGRFSATNVSELQSQIDKTLEYEKYEMPDPSYLAEVVMVAGDDSSFEMTHGNGQINYGTNYYFNEDNGITAHTYLQPLDNYAASTQIIQNISDGVGYANYTAHCSPSGWGTPSFEISDISGLTNAHKYGLLVGNCCQSNQFQDNSFGENLLRAVDKGAIGYIGGTNSTMWDEDFWWGVGVQEATSNPPYDDNVGAYDGMFHNRANEVNDLTEWFMTQGQVVVCGCLAVEESTSSDKLYYWEIYMLMGDPSLIPYLGIPSTLDYSFNPDVLLIGSTSVELNTAPHAYISMFQNDERIAVALSDENGLANIQFENPLSGGEISLVITAQNKIPVIETLIPIATDEPYVLLSDFTPETADFNSVINIDATLENVATEGSGYDANNVIAELSLTQNDEYVTILNSSANFGNIIAGSELTVSEAFSIEIADNVPDQHEILFALNVTSGTEYEWSSNFKIVANAPDFKINEMSLEDDNNDGVFNPGETATLTIAVENIGHANATDVLSELTGNSPYLTIINENIDFNINSGEATEISFDLEANESSPQGTVVTLNNLVEKSVYSDEKSFDIVIGQLPIITIGDETTESGSYPFYTYYENNKTQILYLGSEIGAGEKNIQEIAFDFIALGQDITSLTNLKISMKSVTESQLTNFVSTTDATVVLDEESFQMPTQTGWFSFDIDDYVFNSDGTNNLLIEILWGDNEDWESSYFQVNCTQTTNTTVAFGYDDNVNPPSFNQTSKDRPNIKFYCEGEAQGEIYDITFKVISSSKDIITDAVVKVGSLANNVDNSAETLFSIATGNYTYQAYAQGYTTVSNTFIADEDKTITIELGLSSIAEFKDLFNIYPNPNNGIFNLEIYDNKEVVVSIYDINGRLVLEKVANNTSNQINLSEQPKGVYLIKINTTEKSFNSKIVLY